jgi:hypothetical protein
MKTLIFHGYVINIYILILYPLINLHNQPSLILEFVVYIIGRQHMCLLIVTYMVVTLSNTWLQYFTLYGIHCFFFQYFLSQK